MLESLELNLKGLFYREGSIPIEYLNMFLNSLGLKSEGLLLEFKDDALVIVAEKVGALKEFK